MCSRLSRYCCSKWPARSAHLHHAAVVTHPYKGTRLDQPASPSAQIVSPPGAGASLIAGATTRMGRVQRSTCFAGLGSALLELAAPGTVGTDVTSSTARDHFTPNCQYKYKRYQSVPRALLYKPGLL